jgi:stearoyl-CoA desaturase (Delta-9 desaturase)
MVSESAREGASVGAIPPTGVRAGEISHLRVVAFTAFHLLALAAIWTGVTRASLILCGVLYVVLLLAVTVGHHRYFSHRAFKTSRVMQFILGFWAQTSLQKGVLWWAAHHRYHHRHSDQEDDLHSPKHGILWSYAGWIFSSATTETKYDLVPDLAKFPELRLLDAFPFTPGLILAAACFAIAGWPGLVVGFVWANILVHHATFANNCFAHVFGTRPFTTTDGSRNNWFLAALTLGEGWHNNHHRYPGSARNGFMWWEIDPTYYVLVLLEKLGIIWDLRAPPSELLAERHASTSPTT